MADWFFEQVWASNSTFFPELAVGDPSSVESGKSFRFRKWRSHLGKKEKPVGADNSAQLAFHFRDESSTASSDQCSKQLLRGKSSNAPIAE